MHACLAIVLLSIALLFSYTFCFNVDTKFPIIFSGLRGSYFGYTVALHQNKNGPMALIGAPRSNSSTLGEQLYQPGALFKCDMKASCEEVALDKEGNNRGDANNNDIYYEKKDSMWLGVTLDVLQNSVRKDIVTCGHLWKNQLRRNTYLTNGACYVLNSDLDSNNVSKLLPFVDNNKQQIFPRIYYYAFGQVGTSASFSEDGTYLHLGASGFYDWLGTVVSYDLNSKSIYQEYKQPSIPNPPRDQNLAPESYIGYSVSSGKFYVGNEEYVAVGAPRDGDSCGRVFIYKPVKIINERIAVHQRKNGIQLGEYFGATVLGVNLNGDFYTDLLVAAPLHSLENSVNEGKVYVFISNGLGLQNFAELQGSSKAYARFGTAIANLGDINQDGYNDVAIGAPYEDSKGAIYIYHGSLNGMNIKFVQRIAAKDIDSNLQGFGIHISRGFDVDANQYPDVLVGAYASSDAVLFRTQPVMQLLSKLTFSPKQINTNVTNCIYQEKEVSCVNVTACLLYKGKHISLNLEFKNEIYLEHSALGNIISNRVFFSQSGKSSYVLMQKSKLEIGKFSCMTEVIYIRPDIKNFITPVQVLYRYSLISDENSKDFKNFPVINPLSSSNITSFVSFLTGCGSDDMCYSDLQVSAKPIDLIEGTPLIIGKNSALSLYIEVINLEEPAYMTELLIFLPPEIASINPDICTSTTASQNQRSNATLLCDIGNPLLNNQKVKILIKLDLTKIPTDKKEVFINIEAVTASYELNSKNNVVKVPLNFEAIADIGITGTPTQEQILYDENIEKRSMSLSITHTFFIMNHGPSPIQIVDITLFVPTSFQGKNGEENFITLTNLEADSGKPLTIPAKCNDSNLIIKPVSPEVKKTKDDFGEKQSIGPNMQNDSYIFDSINEIKSTDQITSIDRLKRSVSKNTALKRKTDVVLSCDTSDCVAIQCSASQFSDTRKFARIAVTVQINIGLLSEFFNPWHSMEYVTSGKVTIRNTGNIFQKHNYPNQTEVKTVIIYSGPLVQEKVDEWIIFVSIGVGITLLVIVVILLIKFGFFRRKQKEEMEKMKANEDDKDCDPCENEALD